MTLAINSAKIKVPTAKFRTISARTIIRDADKAEGNDRDITLNSIY
jgi:hypothetical protein